MNPNRPESPYIVGAPVSGPGFYGRHSQIAQFFRMVRQPTLQSLRVLGLRRSGKTSFLLHIAHREVADRELRGCPPTAIAYVSLQACIETPEDFYLSVGSAITGCSSPATGLQVPDSFPTFRSFSQWLEGVFASVEGLRLVVLLDEIEVLAQSPLFGAAFFQSLRSLAGPRFMWVTTSYQDLHTFEREGQASPFFNIFHPLPIILGSLDSEETVDLICDPATGVGVELLPDEVSAIREIAGAMPYLLQATADQWFCIRNPDRSVVQCQNEVLAQLLGPNNLIRYHLDHYYWRYLTDEERDCLRRAALEKLHPGTNPDVELKLLCFGLLCQDKGGLKVAGEVFRRWIEENHQKTEVVSERYVDFDLHIAPGGRVTANSPEGQATADIPTRVPNSLRLALNLIERRETNADLLRQVGQELYGWLFPSPIHTHFHQTETCARFEKAKLRLRLRVEAKNIASLPLEFIYREVGGYFLAVNPKTVLSRCLNLPLPSERVRCQEGPLHMLAIIADPTDRPRLHPDEWESIIRQALAKPLADGQMTLQMVKRATREDIRNALLKQKPNIIQFVGHGIYQDSKGYLALVDEGTGKTWLVDDERFANLYLGHDDYLGLISLATCESARSGDPQGFLGIAPQLVQRGIPAVIAMQYEVYVDTAKVFLEDFYASVAAHKPIDWAIQSARNAISQKFGLDNREFATPVLYMRAQGGDVF